MEQKDEEHFRCGGAAALSLSFSLASLLFCGLSLPGVVLLFLYCLKKRGSGAPVGGRGEDLATARVAELGKGGKQKAKGRRLKKRKNGEGKKSKLPLSADSACGFGPLD